VAMDEGHGDVVRLLLEFYRRPQEIENGLSWAAEKGDLQIARELLSRSVSQRAKNRALLEAIINRHSKVVTLLLGHGADANTRTEDGYTALAASRYSTRLFKTLVKAGATVHTQGSKGASLLEAAVRGGQGGIVRHLLRTGANANARDEHGNTVLFTAAYCGKGTTAKLLIEAGADVFARSHSGNTALHPAAWGGHTEIAELLIAKGADLNARSNEGETPLICAATGGHTDTVRCLIRAGADTNIPDSKGDTALAVAIKERHSATVRLLDAAARQGPKTRKQEDSKSDEFRRTLEILNRLGRELFYLETKRADDDSDGEAQFLRSLMYLADYGTSASALKKIKKEFGEEIPGKLAALHSGGLKHACLFSMFYDSDFPGGTCSGQFVAVHSPSLGCGVCFNDAFEAGVIELIDAFVCGDGPFPPAKSVEAALAYLGRTPPPDEFTNYISSRCKRDAILKAVSEGNWKNDYSNDECEKMIEKFRTQYKESRKPDGLF